MAPIAPTERSRQHIDVRDLERLAEFAAADLADYARRSETGALYEERVLCVALCQGAALHFIDATTGIKDFDVWTFFAEVPGRPFPARRLVARDFGASRFGRSPSRQRLFVGRRVDLLGRSLPATPEDDLERDLRALVEGMNRLTDEPLLDPARVEAEVVARDREVHNPYAKDLQVTGIHAARRYLPDRVSRIAAPHRLLDPEAGPLIGIKLHILTRKTLGGLHTDLSGRVLRPSGEPVSGLYAAGEVAGFGGGGVHGYRSLEGTFLGGCLFSGRVAGRALVQAL